MTKKFLITLLILMTCLALFVPSVCTAWFYDEESGLWVDEATDTSLTPNEYNAMMGGHAPYCNGPGHCNCGAESNPGPYVPSEYELDLRARAKAVGGSWVTELWTERAVLNGRDTELRLFQNGNKVLMKESLAWIPETDNSEKRLTLTLDDENPLKIQMNVTSKTFSAFGEHKVAAISVVSRDHPGSLDFEVSSLMERYTSLGYTGKDVMSISPENLDFSSRYKTVAMEAYASALAKYELYLLTAPPEEREQYDKTGLNAVTEVLKKLGYSFTYSDYVKALSDGTRKPTGKSEAELKELYKLYSASYDWAVRTAENLKKEYQAGRLDDQKFLDEYAEAVMEMNQFFEEMCLAQAELEVFHTNING